MKLIATLVFFLSIFSALSQEDSHELILDGIDKMLANDNKGSLELLEKAKGIAEEQEDFEDLFLAYNNIGANYYSMLDYGEALINYQKAYDLALLNLTAVQEMTAINNIAILYSEEGDFEKALTYFQKAYDLSKKHNEDVKTSMYAINLSLVSSEIGEYDEAKKFVDEAISTIEEQPLILLEAEYALLQYYKVQQVDKAVELANSLLRRMTEPMFEEHKHGIYITLSDLSQRDNNLPEALTFAEKALSHSVKIDNKISAYEQMADLNMSLGNLKKSLVYKDSIISLSERMHAQKNERLYKSSIIKFEIQNYKQTLSAQKQELAKKDWRFKIFVRVAIILFLFGVWAMRSTYLSYKRRKILHKRSEEIMTLELEKKNAEQLLLEKQIHEQESKSILEQERLKREIESKNRKLTAKALFQSQKQDLLSTVVQDLELVKERPADEINIDLHIRRIKKIQKEDGPDDFLTHFEELNQTFLNGLKTKHPDLNTNDIRFLSYLYMNLSMKEIAGIFNITQETCRKRKERIAKKVNLEKSSDLYDYLFSFN